MKAARPASAPLGEDRRRRIFACVFGAFLGLCLLKFGNPPIMEKWVEPPRDIYEIVLKFPWPIVWAYTLLALTAFLGMSVARWKRGMPRWVICLPLLWLGWEALASTRAVDPALAAATLEHFVACVACFYLGFFSLGRDEGRGIFWAGLMCGFLLVLAEGWGQRLGGLEETRQYFFVNVSQLSDQDLRDFPTLAAKLGLRADPVSQFLWSQFDAAGHQSITNSADSDGSHQKAMDDLIASLNAVITNRCIYEKDRFQGVKLRPQTRKLIVEDPTPPEVFRLNRLLLEDAYPRDLARMPPIVPELLQKMTSTRIFSTLLYPNTLAGCLVLLLPPLLTVTWLARELFTIGARRFLVAAIAIGALACLYWSGSKGGWLLMLLIGLAALLEVQFARQLKLALIVLILLAGLAGFFWKYAGFFERGATSVGARFDYWRAAAQITAANPLLGTGPGTFLIPYEKLKRPESESARLVHNDYLEQASDSGVPGALAYTLFIVAGLIFAFPKARKSVEPQGSPSVHSARSAQVAVPAAPARDWLAYSMWLGLLAWSLQGLFEFGLYIPALTWTAFALLGWMLGRDPTTSA